MSARLVAALVLSLGLVTRAALAVGSARDGGAADAPVVVADARQDGAPNPSDAGADTAPADGGSAGRAPPPVVVASTVVPGVLPVVGRVLEKGTRSPIVGAAITVDAAVVGESDTDGRFQLRLPAGLHDLAVLIGGQEVVRRQLDLTAGSPVDEQIFRVLTGGSGARYATKVRAGRPEIPKVEVSGDEARQLPGSSGDPLRVLGSLPGVVQIAWPAALYVVRGANPGNTGFFLDGIRVPELFHLGLELSVIHPYLIDGVDFYPGGAPANYGPYVSGIMAAHTVAPPADRVHASADVTIFDAGGIVTGPWDGGRGTVVVAGRYSYTGALFSALQNDTTLRYGDYQLRVDHPFAGGQATLFAFGALDDVGWTNVASAQQYGALQFHRLDLRWRRGVGGGRLLVGVTGGVDWASSTLLGSSINVRALSAMPRVIYTRPLSPSVDLEVGANVDAQTFATTVAAFQVQQSNLASPRQALSQAAYVTVMIHAGDRLVISPGLRTDLFAEQGTQAFFVEPRLDALFNVSETLSLRADGGRYAQMPSLPVSVPGFEAFGLSDLGAQTSLGGSLGAEVHLPGRLTLGVTGYYQKLRLTDVRNVDLEGTVSLSDPNFLEARDGRAYGAELLLRLADAGRGTGPIFGWLAYTLSWSQRFDDNGVLGRSDWDERHILNVVAGSRLGRNYTVGARFHLNTGRWAPVLDGGGEYQELPTYYQIDLRAERRFVFDRFVMDLYADVANVTRNPEVLQVDAVNGPYPAGKTIMQDQIKLFLPTVGVHAQF